LSETPSIKRKFLAALHPETLIQIRMGIAPADQGVISADFFDLARSPFLGEERLQRTYAQVTEFVAGPMVRLKR
jgi:hypothetical protein